MEGHRLFLRYLSIGLDTFVEHRDPAMPAFYAKSHREGLMTLRAARCTGPLPPVTCTLLPLDRPVGHTAA